MTSNISEDTISACSFLRSTLNWASQSWSGKHEFRGKAKRHSANLARPYHTQPDVASRSPTFLRPDVRRVHAHGQQDLEPTCVPNVVDRALKVGAITIYKSLQTQANLLLECVHPNDRASASPTPTTGLDKSSSIRRKETFGRSSGAGSRIFGRRTSQFAEFARDIEGVLSKVWTLLYTMAFHRG